MFALMPAKKNCITYLTKTVNTYMQLKFMKFF